MKDNYSNDRCSYTSWIHWYVAYVAMRKDAFPSTSKCLFLCHATTSLCACPVSIYLAAYLLTRNTPMWRRIAVMGVKFGISVFQCKRRAYQRTLRSNVTPLPSTLRRSLLWNLELLTRSMLCHRQFQYLCIKSDKIYYPDRADCHCCIYSFLAPLK